MENESVEADSVQDYSASGQNEDLVFPESVQVIKQKQNLKKVIK